MTSHLSALVVDDQAPSCDELVHQLERCPAIAEVSGVADVTEALQWLRKNDCDVVFLGIRTPGLDGLELGRLLTRLEEPPALVFVTAHADHAIEAFGLRAADYLLEPVQPRRLNEALARVQPRPAVAGSGGHKPGQADGDALALVAVESGGVTRLIARDSVLYAEASGDYVRLHTADDHHLVRTPISALQDRWRRYGFMRVHRRFLVSLRHITDWRNQTGGTSTVRVGGIEVPVARRQAAQLRHEFLQTRPAR